jgi:putative phage-type endonuclease
MAIALPVVQRTPAWLEAKEDGIGSSEASAALGLSRWESPLSLWARKLRLVPPPEPTPEMELGVLMEPVLAELYERATGERIRRANRLLQHRDHPWMLASLDRVRTGRRLVELKHTARGDGYGEPGTDEVPDEVLAQVVHQMAVVNAPEADVAVLVGGRPPIRIYTVHRDREAEAALIDGERDFWRHVEERREPPVDGSAATRRALAERYPRDTGEVIVAGEELRAALERLRVIRTNVDQLAEAEAETVAQIKAAMGVAAELVADGIGRVTWRATKDRSSTDWKAVAVELRQSYDLALSIYAAGGSIDVEGVTAWLNDVIPSHTETKPGTRPFVARWEEETDG